MMMRYAIRGPGHALGWILLLAALAALVGPQDASATTRVQRTLSRMDGLPADDVMDLSQDSGGFLWIATSGGLARFDGQNLVPWGDTQDRRAMASIAIAPDDRIVVLDYTGALWRVTPEGLSPLPQPTSTDRASQASGVAFAPDGMLWVVNDNGIWRMDPEHQWHATPEPDGDEVHSIVVGRSGATYLLAEQGVWQAHGEASPERLLRVASPTAVVERKDGALVTLDHDANLHTVTPDGVTVQAPAAPGRGISVAARGGILWVAQDRSLTRVHPREPAQVLSSSDGIHSGGPLLVDEEGSLWLGTFRGLVHLPEPEAISWTEQDGLPSEHGRHLALQGQRLWYTTWHGHGFLDLDTRTATTQHPGEAKSTLCSDAQGRIWGGLSAEEPHPHGVLEHDGTGARVHPVEGLVGYRVGCATSQQGTVWLATSVGLFETRPEGGRPVLRASLPANIVDTFREIPTLEDREGRLWLAGNRDLCWVRASQARRGAGEALGWTCSSLPARHEELTNLVQDPSGSLWTATRAGALWRRAADDDATWTEVPIAALSLSKISKIVVAKQGGLWLLNEGGLHQISTPADPVDPVLLLHQVDGWHGLPVGAAIDLVELQDGVTWVLGTFGLVRLPDVYQQRPRAPRVHLTEALTAGQPLPLDTPGQIPRAGSDLQLSFAATSLRSPTQTRFRSRTRAGAAWSAPTRHATWHLIHLPPGGHQIEVAASNDGARWSEVPATYRFVVPLPWYREPLLVGLIAIACVLILALVHRVRVNLLLREEKMRTTVAMDLHDEVGAGLGSIGLLAQVLQDPQISETDRSSISHSIAASAEELGRSLSAIVWSLHPGSARLDRLTALIADRASRMFPQGGDRQIELRFPDPVPQTPLTLPELRAIQYIALEAMHNAARHSSADLVRVELTHHMPHWTLCITDNGVGLGAATASRVGTGMGHPGMQARADTIGAELQYIDVPEGGTRVQLVFKLQNRPA